MWARHKTAIIIAIAVVIVAIGASCLLYRKHVHFQSPIVLLPQPQRFVNDRPAYTEPTNDAGQNTPSYSNTIMQFDKNCVASPATITAHVGDTIMFDNRSNYQRSITVGAQSYPVGPFGHVVLSFGTRDTYPVSCDSFQNVGIIGIQ